MNAAYWKDKLSIIVVVEYLNRKPTHSDCPMRFEDCLMQAGTYTNEVSN